MDIPSRCYSSHIYLNTSASLSELALLELWQLHQQGLQLYQQKKTTTIPGGVSWLELKRELAHRLLRQCNYCVHLCLVDRSSGQTGYCQLTDRPVISGAYMHHGEEQIIHPTFAIFFGGCTMHCAYCHNWRDTFNVEETVSFMSARQLAYQIQEALHHQNCQSVSFIGGTPEPHLHYILDLAHALPAIPLPLVFNSNATLSDEGLELMAGVVDLYLPDFKHGNNHCAWTLTKIPHYVEMVMHNIQSYLAQGADVLVRHLVLPGHLECCTHPVLACLAQSFPSIKVNVMLHYRPAYKAMDDPLLNRRLNDTEKKQVGRWMEQFKLNRVS